jgi:hypothetical protein
MAAAVGTDTAAKLRLRWAEKMPLVPREMSLGPYTSTATKRIQISLCVVFGAGDRKSRLSKCRKNRLLSITVGSGSTFRRNLTPESTHGSLHGPIFRRWRAQSHLQLAVTVQSREEAKIVGQPELLGPLRQPHPTIPPGVAAGRRHCSKHAVTAAIDLPSGSLEQ